MEGAVVVATGVEVLVETGIDGAPATQVLFELDPTVIFPLQAVLSSASTTNSVTTVPLVILAAYSRVVEVRSVKVWIGSPQGSSARTTSMV